MPSHILDVILRQYGDIACKPSKLAKICTKVCYNHNISYVQILLRRIKNLLKTNAPSSHTRITAGVILGIIRYWSASGNVS